MRRQQLEWSRPQAALRLSPWRSGALRLGLALR
jgi:hypothetical protein